MLNPNQNEHDNIFLLKACLPKKVILSTCTENKISYFLFKKNEGASSLGLIGQRSSQRMRSPLKGFICQ